MTARENLSRLVEVIERHAELAIAVSGGVDSMLLAHVAHSYARTAMTAFHAVSAAVPAPSSARVQFHAIKFGWALQMVEADELADPAYRSNPVDRCFHCKSRLYERIGSLTRVRIASGTNIDDLGDYRPGLEAARCHEVVHPFVESGLGKRDIYALACELGLDDLAALPAQPCLASRIETGIPVGAGALRFIENAECVLSALLPKSGSIRCRITAEGVYVECETLPSGAEREQVESRMHVLCAEERRTFRGVRPYRRGSAFLRSSE